MGRLRYLVALAAILAVLPLSAFAQSVISAKSGLVQVADGEVYLDGKALKLEFGQFPSLPENSVLKTSEGRSEVLLTPGVFLRSGADSSLKLISSRLSDTRVEVLTGRHDVEVVNLEEDNAVTISMGAVTVPLDKPGVYRFDAGAGVIKVYEGKLEVRAGDSIVSLKKGRYLSVNNGMQVASFDPDSYDGLLRWTARRSKYISMANISAARTAYGSGYYSSGMPSRWMWNPYLGLMTYLPGSGSFNSPFGWYFYSPRAVYSVYYPPVVPSIGGGGFGGAGGGWSQQGGYSVSSPRSSGGAYSASPSMGSGSPAAAASAPAASPRSGGDATPRGGGSGGHR